MHRQTAGMPRTMLFQRLHWTTRHLGLAWLGAIAVLGAAATTRGQAPPATVTVAARPEAITPAEYAERRKALRQVMLGQKEEEREEARAGKARLALLRGADVGDRQDYEEGRFYQEANFSYLTGVDIPGAFVLIDANADRDTLYLPARRLGDADLAASLGFAEVAVTDRLLGDLFTRLGSAPQDARTRGRGHTGARLLLLNPQPGENATSAEGRFVRWLRGGATGVEYAELSPLLGELRKPKTGAEVAILQRAIDITGEAQKAAARSLRPGAYEYRLEGAIANAFLAGGAMRPGFASIVGSGPKSCIPHYFENDRQIEDGDLVVVDIGAEYRRYTADITRTYPANGRFSPRQRELYQAVLDAQRHAEERFEPGKTRLGEMTGWVRTYLRNLPLRAQAGDGSEQTLDHFFIHGLSHYLGLDVHDVGNIGVAMQAGEVFTIEPGLYIPAENIGIRIEDDYLVTEQGLDKLSKGIASEPDAVEALMAGSRESEGVGIGR